MTTARRSPSPRRRASLQTVNAEAYNAFISQIELSSLWVRSASVDNPQGSEKPEDANVDIVSTAHWEPADGGFTAFHNYDVAVHTGETTAAQISVTFGLDFESAEPMTKQIFQVFQEVNLPVNTWPYLRSFLAETFDHMGWPSLTLPTLKMGVHRQPSRKSRRTT